MIGASVTLWLALALAACGGGESTHGDDDADAGPGEDSGPEDAGTIVTVAPTAPERPEMTPCPDGWAEVPDADDPAIVTCHPFGEGGPIDCAAVDEADFAGGGECERIGSACPAGDFAEDFPAGSDVVYVRAGAAAGGDGTLATPFATIADALAAAPDGAILALSKGTFDEVVAIDRPRTLWGACVAETIVASSAASDDDSTITFTGTAGGGVRNLQVTGARRGISVNGNSAVVEIDSVAVHDAVAAAIAAEPGIVHVSNAILRDMQTQADGHRGNGLRVALGGQMTVERVAIERTFAGAIRVSEATTTFVGTNLVARDTAPEVDTDLGGFALQATDGAHVEFHQAAILRNHENALVVAHAGTTFLGEDLFVADTQSRATNLLIGFGLHVIEGAHAELSRATFLRNRAAAIESHDDGTELVISDLVAEDTLEEEADLRGGVGLSLLNRMHADLSRVAFLRNSAAGFAAADLGTEATLADVVVRDTATDPNDGTLGVGIGATAGALVVADRVLLERNHSAALVAELGSTITVTDLDAQGTQPRDDGRFGTGMLAVEEGIIEATRFRSAGNVLCGVQVAANGTMDLHEGEVSGNRIGANIQTPDYAIARLQDGVLFLHNVVDLDTSLLPVPDAVPELGK